MSPIALLLAAALVGCASASSNVLYTYNAVLSAASEAPLKGDLKASGTFTVQILKGLTAVKFSFEIMNLTTPPPIAQHIHMGALGVAGPVVIPFTGTWSVMKTKVTLFGQMPVKSTILKQIIANPAGFYANAHTKDFPAGAVRGQLSAPAVPKSRDLFITALTGKAEVPMAGDLKVSGLAKVSIPLRRASISYSLTVKNLAGPVPIAQHIHKGAPGVAGPVVVTLTGKWLSQGGVYYLAASSIPANATVLKAIVASPKDYYVNIHTVKYPGGAARGQL